MVPVSTIQAFDGSIPANAGIGLRAPHLAEFLDRKQAIDWVEVHSENYFGHGIPVEALMKVRERYAVSLHGIGLSIGSADPLNLRHLRELKELIARVEPGFVSEHLCWSSIGGRYLNDLLPLPYTLEALLHLADRVTEIQDRFGRTILIENISSYLEFTDSDIPEWEFVAELAARSGCGILLDVNNVYVSSRNHGFDPYLYLLSIPIGPVAEMHLAGFTRKELAGGEILIDSHNRPVAPEVWSLYAAATARFGATPVLIEWDSDLPELGTLLEEAGKAQTILETRYVRVA